MKTLIVYGSTTGNTETVANQIGSFLKGNGCEVTVESAASCNAACIADYELILLGSSTWGDGELQDDMIGFYDELDSISFEGKKAATFGTGEDTWPQFCEAVNMLEKKVSEKGAAILFEGLKVNGEVDANQAEIDSWLENLKAKI